MRKVLLVIVIAISIGGFAQKRANYWHFGNGAGFDFSSGDPVGITSAFDFSVEEGTSSISSEAGDLLLYSDGSKVYDATSSLMPNGTGLSGNGSSQQSCIIIPDPSNSDHYYLFSQGGEAGGLAYRYSFV